jgi:hypothetical protein
MPLGGPGCMGLAALPYQRYKRRTSRVSWSVVDPSH